MKTVTYRGPGHVLKAGGRTFYRGEPQAVSDALYRQLLRDPSMTLDVSDPIQPVKEPEPPADEAASDTAEQGEEESNQ